MRRTLFLLLTMMAILAAFAPMASALERSQVPEKYQWRLSDLYASEAAWNSAKADLEKRIPALAHFQGRLGGSAESLAIAIDARMKIDRDLAQLYVYASMLSDQDVRVSSHVAMKSSAGKLYVDYGAAAAFFQPEILAIGADKVRKFIASDPKLKPYRMYLEDILRQAPHTLGTSEEKIVAQAGLMATAGQDIRDVFANAEMPYPEIKLANGENVRLDAAAYTAQRQSTNRADRDSVFCAFWTTHQEFQGTLAAALNAEVRSHVFTRDVRHYKSCVEAAMFGDNIPPR